MCSFKQEIVDIDITIQLRKKIIGILIDMSMSASRPIQETIDYDIEVSSFPYRDHLLIHRSYNNIFLCDILL